MKHLFLMTLIFCSNSYASSIQDAKVTRIAFNAAYGNFAFVKLDTPPERESCSINGSWDYTLDLNGEVYQSIYALLLAAHLAGTTVSIGGTGTCNEFPSIESIQSFYSNK